MSQEAGASFAACSQAGAMGTRIKSYGDPNHDWGRPTGLTEKLPAGRFSLCKKSGFCQFYRSPIGRNTFFIDSIANPISLHEGWRDCFAALFALGS
jgi:hypothetical protein